MLTARRGRTAFTDAVQEGALAPLLELLLYQKRPHAKGRLWITKDWVATSTLDKQNKTSAFTA